MTVPRRLGERDVFPVGYGAMSFADFYGPATQSGSHAILDACLELGVDHLDTSNVYGNGQSETWIGSWLDRVGRGMRDRFHIATKAGITQRDGKRVFDNSPEHLEAELDGSLARMGVDHVDLFYVHRREHERPIEEVAGALSRLVEKGKTRTIGFSEIAPSSLRRAHAVHPVAAVQSEYSLATRAPELGLIQACEELGVALVAFSPVGRGMLTDRPPDADKVAPLAFLNVNPRFVEPNLSANRQITDGFRALAAEMGTSAAALACAWTLQMGDHVIPIPGTRSVDHLRECAAGAALSLGAAEMARIEEVLPVGWAHGDRYSDGQWIGPERFS
ncbi:MAG: aldo/keto reductase [Pseudomonadota bacterium]